MIVSLLVLGTFTIVNSLVIKMLLNENQEMHSAIRKDSSKDLEGKVNRLSKQIKPIVTEKYKTNKVKAWKQFNLWKNKCVLLLTPLLDVNSPTYPSGMFTAMSVLIVAFSCGSSITVSAAKMSYPASNRPRSGVVASFDNFLNSNVLVIYCSSNI